MTGSRKECKDVDTNAKKLGIIDSTMTSFADRLWESIGDESVLSFAKRSGVSEGVVRKYVKGETEPTVGRLVAMARAAGVSINWLATGEDSESKDDLTGIVKKTDTPIDIESLRRSIELLDEALIATGRIMDSSKKAELISAIYELEVNNQKDKRRDVILKLFKSIG
ncbi:helix-turn-helix protein|uniref:Helix-turn-helix protein n=1 Tax=Brenneria salicis ATCC 15712 = DSM 30166 TaxID=714314 RepID=A0A366IAB7_9GAMM|nr:helix-turn-helix transcriptional regulator [Brenneria salicis]NMN90561.1 helix-turn-helix protein [Brenneria salicis ATCC 15712 = DSM 30166]RBP64893.1 helix-turn-helix protein [Brenneria salicis ATCC 15712 = DSM 30166]RLM31606.1 hypothetical protein BHG07_04945 [Brenneria salicis ATCC 15712 = DSM 30166]